MRPSILHPLRESRHARRHRRGHSRAVEPASEPCDPDARRVREAGGPLDRASYTCSCGYVFRASVSTSVSCPHCGAEQAW